MGSPGELQVYVVFTDLARTRAAISTATSLARALSARLILLIAKTVPWPSPIDIPPVSKEFTERLVSELALAGEQDTEVAARIYLCRDAFPTIRSAIEPGSIVVIGEEKPSLSRLLSQDGHQVIPASDRITHTTRPSLVNIPSSLHAL